MLLIFVVSKYDLVSLKVENKEIFVWVLVCFLKEVETLFFVVVVVIVVDLEKIVTLSYILWGVIDNEIFLLVIVMRILLLFVVNCVLNIVVIFVLCEVGLGYVMILNGELGIGFWLLVVIWMKYFLVIEVLILILLMLLVLLIIV